ncbi:NAD(P)H-dependent flavin oxidoreductase [Nocardia shimofusensis]|uniref:NAD(P)H-dependent flavin oxidoreductase n=1 Tax=Nocardia shimofusensis TaxID=228596 RepID=UPI0008334EB6|nr:nitronate monooxygenase [Nocardia shimofusensis]
MPIADETAQFPPGSAVEPALVTPWSRALGLRVPVVNAPMGGVAGGRLAAAVTAAGGLGMIGMGSAATGDALRRELAHTEPVTGPFGIGLVDWVVARRPELLEIAIAARPALIAISFGEDLSWAARVREHGIRTATQVFTADHARRAADAGVEVLVARGLEGGGHGAIEMATVPLLDAVLAAVDIPVLAAGGIGSAASLAAVLAAGAGGAWIGTALAACAESSLSATGRQAMLAADGADTVVTTAVDVALGYPWPAHFPSRVLRNDFVTAWTGHEDALRADAGARDTLRAGIAADDPRVLPVDAGQGVGLVTAVEPVARVLDGWCRGAAELLAPRTPIGS